MIVPVIEMPVYNSVDSIKVEPVSEVNIDTWFDVQFAVRVIDDGLVGLNIEIGDLLLFQPSHWPEDHEQIVLACYENEEYFLRILEQFDPYGPIRLRGTRDVPILKAHKHSIIVKGICCYVLKEKHNKILYIDTFDGTLHETAINKPLPFKSRR